MTTAVTEVLADAQEIRHERGRILSALMDDAEAIADRGATAIQREIVAYAQGGGTVSGGISGRVIDETGAVLPGATVTATNTATNQTRLLSVKGFLVVGHDEYWTREMYDAAQNARDCG